MSEREQQESEAGFFDRWSRRKASRRQGEVLADEPERPVVEDATASAAEENHDAPVRIDERTGKPYDELTDDDMPPLESLNQDSDVSMFMARNISPDLRRKALRTLFRSSKFNKISLCAEYAEDYTTWTPMGDVVPHDWKRAIAREAERARQKLADAMDDEMTAADEGVELADADRAAAGTATGADGHEPITDHEDR